jgi:hypothetical protein
MAQNILHMLYMHMKMSCFQLPMFDIGNPQIRECVARF